MQQLVERPVEFQETYPRHLADFEADIRAVAHRQVATTVVAVVGAGHLTGAMRPQAKCHLDWGALACPQGHCALNQVAGVIEKVCVAAVAALVVVDRASVPRKPSCPLLHQRVGLGKAVPLQAELGAGQGYLWWLLVAAFDQRQFCPRCHLNRRRAS